MASAQNPKWQKRRPLDDVPGLKLDVVLEERRAVIKIDACGHQLVFDEVTKENDPDRDSERWQIFFDGEEIARERPHPDGDWPLLKVHSRDKIQTIRGWVWEMARAHKVNAENILEIRDKQFPESCVAQIANKEYVYEAESAGEYFRRALRQVWEL